MTSVLFDFSDPRSVALWNPINDRVMGAVSHSQLRNDPAGHALFCGHVSFENNGGFASVRCQPGDFGKKEVIAYLLEVCGDGKRYKLNLRTDEVFDGVVYQVGFIPPTGQWATCRLASADFLPSWRVDEIPILGHLIPIIPIIKGLFGRGPLKQKSTTLSGTLGAEGFTSGALQTDFVAKGGSYSAATKTTSLV